MSRAIEDHLRQLGAMVEELEAAARADGLSYAEQCRLLRKKNAIVWVVSSAHLELL